MLKQMNRSCWVAPLQPDNKSSAVVFYELCTFSQPGSAHTADQDCTLTQAHTVQQLSVKLSTSFQLHLGLINSWPSFQLQLPPFGILVCCAAGFVSPLFSQQSLLYYQALNCGSHHYSGNHSFLAYNSPRN